MIKTGNLTDMSPKKFGLFLFLNADGLLMDK